MSVIDQLACSLGRRDELPNQQLAGRLVESADSSSIHELVENLSNEEPAVQSDCIKVLYEIGYLKPELVAPYARDFLKLLSSRNNRLVWGGALALSTVAALAADELASDWREISGAMETGSVITRDAGVLALARIACAAPRSSADIFPYLLEHLRSCRPKDVPQHCEKTLLAVNISNKAEFVAVLETRLEHLHGTEVKRVQKVIRVALAR